MLIECICSLQISRETLPRVSLSKTIESVVEVDAARAQGMVKCQRSEHVDAKGNQTFSGIDGAWKGWAGRRLGLAAW